MKRLMIVLLALLGFQTVAAQSRCDSEAVRWASSTNTVYVSGDLTVCHLAELVAVRDTIPLVLGDETSHAWILSASIVVTDGATLLIHGIESEGMVDELRLMSNNSPASHVSISVDNGQLSIVNSKITSWDTTLSAPDTEYLNGRAFIRVRSRVSDDGAVLTSRLTIDQSTLEYLGFDASESYGVSMKAIRPEGLIPEGLFVYGSITDSFFRYNYYGLYLYRATDTLVEGNYVGSNVEYGIDLHHDCTNVVVSDNHTSLNGSHGIICSDGCSNITVTSNESFDNGGHGIMFHVFVNDSLIENNYSHDNTKSGIELFDSHRNTVRGNRLFNNNDGIRVSVGSSENLITNNTLDSNRSRAIYVYIGNDNSLTGTNRPHGNVISNNTITRHSSDEPIRLTDGLELENTVEANTVVP